MVKAKNTEKWEIEGAVDTLIRAQEIMNDKQLFPKVKQAFIKKQRAMQETALELKITEKQSALRDRGD